MIKPSDSITNIPRLNRKILPALKRLGIRTIRDLLFHFPSRYDDFSNCKKISEIVLNEVVTIRGRIAKMKTMRTSRKHMLLVEAKVEDETGSLKTLWFNQPFLSRNLKIGDVLNLSGKFASGPYGRYLQNPAYEKIPKISPEGNLKTVHTAGLVAIYPETAGITSRWLRFLIKNSIFVRQGLTDALPLGIRQKYNLPEIKQAIFSIHFPQNPKEAERAQRRFDFEDLLMLQLHALKERMALKQQPAPAIRTDLDLIKKFVKSLPYELTNSQRRSIWEIVQDLAKPRPMNRLLEGDVGSGKTVVAAAAALLTVKDGYKVAFMAPTEILARQHFETLRKVLQNFEAKIGLLVGSEKKISHQPDIIVGTHALIQKSVFWKNLGLVIVDEQHRFGVEQRAMLQNQETRIKNQENDKTLILDSKFLLPHFLSMSATPIPRTLSLTVYGDLDLSILDEMPKSRKEIITKIIEPQKRNEAYDFIRQEIKSGRQIFIICPRIELPTEDEKRKVKNERQQQQKLLLWEVKAVKEEFKKLAEKVFPDLKVAMLHGKMKPKEKEKIMAGFRNQETDILVSTSVIEVGVDIPNATIMVIEGAERFGLAQLHQFRGRVGRGEKQSYCFLFTTEGGPSTTRRLQAVVEAKNGFELAEKDLEIRGPGDFFGTKQWGESKALMAAAANPKLVHEVRAEAIEIIKRDPTLKSNSALADKLRELEKIVHLE